MLVENQLTLQIDIGLDWIGLDPQGAMPDSASAKNLWASSWARAHGPRPKAELGLPMGVGRP